MLDILKAANINFISGFIHVYIHHQSIPLSSHAITYRIFFIIIIHYRHANTNIISTKNPSTTIPFQMNINYHHNQSIPIAPPTKMRLPSDHEYEYHLFLFLYIINVIMLTLNPTYIYETLGLNRMLMVFQFEIVFF